MIDSLSSTQLLAALESNMGEFWAAYGRGAFLHVDSSALWFYTGIPFPLFNGVVSARLDQAGVETTCQALQAKIDTGGVPALWWVGPLSQPADLGRLLEQRGLERAGQVPGLALPLEQLQPASSIDGFTIRRVAGTEMQREWARIAATGTGLSAAAVPAMIELEARLDDAGYRAQLRYIGYFDGVPVASSAMVMAHGVAGIYAVATLAPARRRGFGSAMTLAPLREAHELGYRVGILQASEAGYPIYKRAGFVDVCKYDLYLQS